MAKVWTIGHSNHALEDFVEMLVTHNIKVLGDVKRWSGSKSNPQYHEEPLSKALAEKGIAYMAFRELGGRRTPRKDSVNTVWRNAAFQGYADHMESEEFEQGIARLLEVAGQADTAIMCSEAVWWRCHRSLIADYLKVREHEVVHIMTKSPKQDKIHPYTTAAKIVDGKLSYAE